MAAGRAGASRGTRDRVHAGAAVAVERRGARHLDRVTPAALRLTDHERLTVPGAVRVVAAGRTGAGRGTRDSFHIAVPPLLSAAVPATSTAPPQLPCVSRTTNAWVGRSRPCRSRRPCRRGRAARDREHAGVAAAVERAVPGTSTACAQPTAEAVPAALPETMPSTATSPSKPSNRDLLPISFLLGERSTTGANAAKLLLQATTRYTWKTSAYSRFTFTPCMRARFLTYSSFA